MSAAGAARGAPAAAYAEACRYLYSLSPLGVQLGTERLAEVLRRLGDPQRQGGS